MYLKVMLLFSYESKTFLHINEVFVSNFLNFFSSNALMLAMPEKDAPGSPTSEVTHFVSCIKTAVSFKTPFARIV